MTTQVAIEAKENSPIGPIKVTDQDGKGKAIFDTVEGNLKSSSVDQKMTLTFSIGGQVVETKSEAVTTMERLSPGKNP
jgi:hypothetical protein